jgi:predicted cobalt transporter CbtA
VGDTGTLAERQGLYVAVICIAAALGLGATVLDRRLRAAGWPDHRRLPAVVAGVAVPMLLAYALLPPAPDEVSVPATLVWRFRVASLGANLALWATLTLGLAWLVAEAQRRRTPAEQPAPASLTVTP